MANKKKKAKTTTRDSILHHELRVINIGIPTFADDLLSQGVAVVRVDWKPPAGGDPEMLELLEKLGS